MSDEVQQIKDKIDVADLVGEYVQLKSAGTNKKGLCPFHHEKSPSFMVSSERGSWHCFGCAKGGDIFSFVQEIEGMEFKEALKYLADKAGVVLTSYKSEVDSSQKNRIKNINTEAARFFHNFLLKISTAKPAMDYLMRRGLKIETISEWQVGFIPEQWDLLTQYLLKKGFAINDLVAAGLTIKREGADEQTGRGFYDRFRGRVMFPIWNVHDEVVGFTGRILVEKENSGGKYVNTPQTDVYDKSRVIYGLNKAKQQIKAKNLIVMVEGQMDVIACHQAGMKNVVATSGTAFTDEQIKLLSRYTKNLNMAFDLDSAGLNAAEKYVGPALRAGLNVVLTRIPEGLGKDADECIKNDRDKYFDAVNKAEDILAWFLYKVCFKRDINNFRDKELIVDDFIYTLIQVTSSLVRDHWLKELSEKVSIDKSVLQERMLELKTSFKPPQFSSIVEKSQKNFIKNKGRFELLVERLLSLLLRFPVLKNEVNPELSQIISASVYSPLYEKIKIGYNVNEVAVNQEKEDLLDILLLQSEWEFAEVTNTTAKNELQNISQMVREEWQKKRRRELQREIEFAEKNNETEKLKILFEEFGNLNN